MIRGAVVFVAAMVAAFGGDVDGPVRIGPGVTPPRVVKKVEPEYTPLARAQQIQGQVVFDIVVDERGRVSEMTVLSPLGYGLDERAQEAMSTWEFEPGRKGGLELIGKAAEKDYAEAVYELRVRRREGRGVALDVENGLKEMREAAAMGSRQAQLDLGNRYEAGDGVERERGRWTPEQRAWVEKLKGQIVRR